jgi:LysR family transcriptional regulator, glycine cleavage system transcriptional activator
MYASVFARKTKMTIRRICPSITELQAFDASSRHGSFTQAARELHCTQGAVSRQILSLEQTVGVALFERMRHGLVLTEAGKSYLQTVKRVLSDLEAATVQLLSHGGQGGTVHVAALPTISAKWLIPRLPRFYAKHPEITLTFLPHTQSYDFSRLDLDVAIRFGEGVWQGASADYLIGREAVVIVPPQKAEKFKRGIKPADLLKLGLLHHTTVPHAWADWFTSVGATVENPHIGQRFDQFTLLIQAVSADLGVAIVPKFLVEDELVSRRVAAPFAAGVSLPQGYFVCVPESKIDSPSIRKLVDWLIEEAKST